MECFAIFLLLLVVGLWSFGSAFGQWSRRSKRRQLFVQMARTFRGVYNPGGWFAAECVSFRYADANVMVRRTSSPELATLEALQVQITCPVVRTRCDVLARTSPQRPDSFARSGPAIDVGDQLSATFQVRGHDAREVRQLLTSGVCWQIERLAALGNDRRLHVRMRDGHVRVLKPWLGLRAEMAAQIVQEALELADQCKLAKAAGIQFLHADEAQLLQEVACKICGEEIEDQMVVCVRCKTPHHQDCWQYIGGCSVFGCRETNYM